MIAYLGLFGGFFLLGCVFAYINWTWLREDFLARDMAVIRVEFVAAVTANGQTDHPDFKRCVDVLRATERVGKYFSIGSIIAVMKYKEEFLRYGTTVELPEAQIALARCAALLSRYVLYDRASGWIFRLRGGDPTTLLLPTPMVGSVVNEIDSMVSFVGAVSASP